ncbi:4d39f5ac-9ba7-4cab-9d83-27631aa1918a [Thermothielavioides terrestris]|uniref:4d39f5ac-9ba7-4cab-9d83-27631aa1918a n=1 Tax=Thermothielavioides terrestris TaxID=2587410 RepID=A0A446BCW7_9PEZI|nr:4d39f5ac-9ba7-4cab-9d83-27631aa1918a [Thermothielavioides terrestris]
MSGVHRSTQSSTPSTRLTDTSSIPASDSWLTDRIVTIFVGPEKKRWVVHEKLLISQSEFFRAYFAAGHDEMTLPDEEPKLFALFMRWLYGTAFQPSGGGRSFRYLQPDGVQLTVRDYLGVYVMGYKFGIVGVRNAVIDVLYTYYGEASDDHEAPNMHDVKYIFENTLPGAPMRRLLTAHSLFYLFSKDRVTQPLPRDWVEVLNSEAEIGFAIIQMLAEWGWYIGGNAPRMTVKPRADFHERVPIVKDEPVDDPLNTL